MNGIQTYVINNVDTNAFSIKLWIHKIMSTEKMDS